MHCLFWAQTRPPKRPPSIYAARGTAVHQACENYLASKDLPALDADGKAMWEQLRRWLDANARPDHCELPILYDVENDTAEVCEIGDEGPRDYLGVTATKIPMTLDLAWKQSNDDGPIVLDTKTGSRSNVEPAARNMQLATQALGFSRLIKWTGPVSVGLLFPMKTKVHDSDRALLDVDTLEAHAGKLHRRLRMLPNAEPVKDSHCWRCPLGPSREHKATCPAWAEEAA